MYVIKAKYQLLAVANLLIYHYFYMLNYSVIYNMFLWFGDTVIDFGSTHYQRQIFSNAENVIKSFSVVGKNSK